jgi:AraC family transcriptional regulator
MFCWPQGYECNWRWWPADENAKPPKLTMAYLKQSFLEKVSIEVFDIEPGSIELINKLCVRDEFARQLILAVRNELAQGNPCGQIYAETAAQMLALHAISKHCAPHRSIKICRGGLTGSQLRVVLDYIDAAPA